MNCIRCNSQMTEVRVENLLVDVCSSCDGLWFDEGELSRLMKFGEEKVEQTEIYKSLIPDKYLVPQERFEDIHCPLCNNMMDVQIYCYDSGIKINKCKVCNGIWVDDGELKKMFLFLKESKKPLDKAQEVMINANIKLIKEKWEALDPKDGRTSALDSLPPEVRIPIEILMLILKIWRA